MSQKVLLAIVIMMVMGTGVVWGEWDYEHARPQKWDDTHDDYVIAVGTEEKLEPVQASDVVKALEEGKEVRLKWVRIEGQVEFHSEVKQAVYFIGTQFSGKVHFSPVGTPLMDIFSVLFIIAALLVAIGTCFLGSVLFLDRSVSNLTQKRNRKQNVYWEIRRQMDRSTELYEISRIFMSFKHVSKIIDPDSKGVLHKNNYIAILKQSESSAFNAAYGNTTSEKEQRCSKAVEDQKMSQGRNTDQIHQNILEFIPTANDRCNTLIRDVRELDKQITKKDRCKVILQTTGIFFNSVGILLGALVQLLQKL